MRYRNKANRNSDDPAASRVEGSRTNEAPIDVPRPSASYRRRAWATFQQALDPLAPLKPPPTRKRV
jgi:hypothetical protein